MLLQDALTQVLQVLEDESADCALLGGLAVSAWTEPRFTRDVDLAVAVSSDADAERLIHSLSQRGYRLLAAVEQTAVNRLSTARLLPPGEELDGMVVDLLFASSGIEPEIVEAAVALDLGAHVPVPVACVGHLVVLKLLAQDEVLRPQDALDLRALREVLDETETERAAVACALVMARGYARGRDLPALLRGFLAGG